jgi:hypothetical protein
MATGPLRLKDVKKQADLNSDAITKITKFLFGNGVEGLDEITRNIQKELRELAKNFEDYKTIRRKEEDAKEQEVKDEKIWRKRFIVSTIVATTIPYALSFIVWIIYWATKLQPLLADLEKLAK